MEPLTAVNAIPCSPRGPSLPGKADAGASPDSGRLDELRAADSGQCIQGSLVRRGQAVQVPLRGDDAGVAEALLDHLQVGATGQEPGLVRVAQVMHPQPSEPGRFTRRVPHLTAEPVGRDVPVGFPGPWRAGTVLAARTPGGPVAGVSTAAVLAPAPRGVVGREGAVPVPPAMDIRVRQAGCLDDAEAAPGSGPGRGLVAEEQVIRSQPASADVSQELGGDLGA